MKRTLLLLSVLLAAAGGFAQTASVTTPTADTWLRTDNNNDNSSKTTLEMRSVFTVDAQSGDTTYTKDFVTLLAFNMPTTPTGYIIDKASLRVVTERVKGNKECKIYAFTPDFVEKGNYTTYASEIAAARKSGLIATIELKGKSTAISSDNITDANYQTISAWQNTVDITSYLKTVTAEKFGLMMGATKSSDNSNNIFSKEATGINNQKCDYFKGVTASDLVPQLTVTYKAASTVTIQLPYEYQTYCPTQPLDFTDNTAVEAYTAKLNDAGTAVTLTKVTKVPAGEGVVLKKTGSDTSASVYVLDAAAALEDNQLVGVTEANSVTAESLVTAGNAYVLTSENTFGKVVSGASGTMAAGKAYLQAPTASAAKALAIDFASPTAVSNVTTTAGKADNVIYNMQGMRVSKPTAPGIYIMNGKKFRL